MVRVSSSSSLSDSSLLLSESSSGLPAFPGAVGTVPLLGVPLTRPKEPRTWPVFSEGCKTFWLSVATGSPSLSDSSVLSESSSCFLVLLTVLSWTGGVIAAFPGVEAAFFPEDTLVDAGEALVWVAFTEGFTSMSVSSLELEVLSLELLDWTTVVTPGWTVVLTVCMLPSSSVSETKMVSADGPDDFLGDFPDRSWATVFPDVGSATEFTIMLVFLVGVFSFKLADKTVREAKELVNDNLGVVLGVSASASSSSSSELSELLAGSDTRVLLAWSAASSSALRFWPTSEVSCQCV